MARPKRVALGAIYATLDRLEDKELVTSWLSDPTPERGGRSKRYYRLERSGEEALRDAALTAKRICDAVEESWGGNVWTPRKWKPARQS
jgi:DNA-binding PadR family transcriptional regulator